MAAKKTKTPTLDKLLEELLEELQALLNKASTPKSRKSKAAVEEEEEEESEEEESEESEESEEEEESEESEEEEEESEEEESEESEEEEEESEEEEDDAAPTWAQLKKLIDTHGDAKPQKMKTILASFNIKNTAELKANKKKWAAVFRKVKASFKK